MSVKRKILVTLKWLVLITYMVIGLSFVTKKNHNVICKGIEVKVVDSSMSRFITSRDIKKMINQKGKTPIGKPLGAINTYQIERNLSELMAVRDVQVYKTVDGILKVRLKQRLPMVRIFNKDNQSYYIDDQGLILPLSGRFTAHVLVVNGNIKEPFPVKANQNIMERDTSIYKHEPLICKIYNFARFVIDDDFWNAQITQVYVNEANDIELIPRVGSQVILLGSLDNFEKKLEKLKMFYEKALPAEGWNKYKMINLKYSNQIICTKR